MVVQSSAKNKQKYSIINKRHIFVFVIIISMMIIFMHVYHGMIVKTSDIKIIMHQVPTIQLAKRANKTLKETEELYLKSETYKPVKSILLWTKPNSGSLEYLLNINGVFVKRKCKTTNCYVTTDKTYLPLTEYDVLLFNGKAILNKINPILPSNRSLHQKYVFASIESSDYYPICDNKFDNYFNISWTYKLNSDIFYGYIVIRNSKGQIIGPQKDMNWISVDMMNPINGTIKRKLSSKIKLAAWFVSNCRAPSHRDGFVKKVQSELIKLGTDMRIHVYGRCGGYTCPLRKMNLCLKNIERYYYFYFSFENSFSEDYVTEKLLYALQYYSVPVVYGTANYSRFMPDGIYLNALKLGPQKLAKRMLEIVADKEQYYNYFKWMNHYSFHSVEEVPETDVFCKFCEAMNDDSLMNKTSTIKHFKDWWNPPTIRQHVCPPKY